MGLNITEQATESRGTDSYVGRIGTACTALTPCDSVKHCQYEPCKEEDQSQRSSDLIGPIRKQHSPY